MNDNNSGIIVSNYIFIGLTLFKSNDSCWIKTSKLVTKLAVLWLQLLTMNVWVSIVVMMTPRFIDDDLMIVPTLARWLWIPLLQWYLMTLFTIHPVSLCHHFVSFENVFNSVSLLVDYYLCWEQCQMRGGSQCYDWKQPRQY